MKKNFKLVPGSKGARRSFAVTCGLQEGYEDGTLHTFQEAVEVALEWMRGRAAAGEQYLTGTFVQGEVVFAWPEGPGKAGGGHEATVIYQGEVSPIYNAGMTDEEAVEILNDLAAHLGTALGQTRVYVALCDQIWILQAEETETPTGETV